MYLLMIAILVLSLLALVAKRKQKGLNGFKSLLTPIFSYMIGIVVLISFYTHTFGPWTFFVCVGLLLGALVCMRYMKQALIEAANN